MDENDVMERARKEFPSCEIFLHRTNHGQGCEMAIRCNVNGEERGGVFELKGRKPTRWETFKEPAFDYEINQENDGLLHLHSILQANNTVEVCRAVEWEDSGILASNDVEGAVAGILEYIRKNILGCNPGGSLGIQ
ncbi:MAG: hypothetical protein PHV97_00615 [Candidatus Omnitrophica bacterium]|nr:hypothetical protein [Candidatus Omnitrophota bacterium]